MSHGSTRSRREQLRGADELAAAKTGSTPVPLVPLPATSTRTRDTLTTSKLPAPTTTPATSPAPQLPHPKQQHDSQTKQCPAAEMPNLDTVTPPMK